MLDRVHPPKRDATIYALTSLMLNDLRALPNAPPCYFTSLGGTRVIALRPTHARQREDNVKEGMTKGNTEAGGALCLDVAIGRVAAYAEGCSRRR